MHKQTQDRKKTHKSLLSIKIFFSSEIRLSIGGLMHPDYAYIKLQIKQLSVKTD